MCQSYVLQGIASLTKPQHPLIQRIKNDQSLPIKLIGYQHAIKSSKRFTCTNTTPINNIISHVLNQIQTSRVFQTTWCCFSFFIVGLQIEFLTEDSSIIHFSFILLIKQHILWNIFFQSKPSYALPINQKASHYLGSLLILGSSLLFMLPKGGQFLLFNIVDYFMASKHFIQVIIILIMLVT